MLRIIPILLTTILSLGLRLSAQDCAEPSQLCYQEFDNITFDSTQTGPLMTGFSCGVATNGTLYQVTTVADGDFDVQIQNVNCQDTIPDQGDELQVAIFTSTNAADPCDPAAMTELFCTTVIGFASFPVTGAVEGETYYVAVFGDMDLTETSPAECDYGIQTDGAAVEISLGFPSMGAEVLSGESHEVTGISGADSYMWEGLGLIVPPDTANPVIFPPQVSDPSFNTFDYTLTSTVGDCEIVNTLTITVIPNIVAADVLTPNDDGFNDFWVVGGVSELAEVQIYSRWGQKVFTSIGYAEDQRWDGTFNGSRLPAGAYYYVIDLNLPENNPDPFTGTINLIY